MEYRDLKYFLVVAREENVTRAAEVLHISQPALSRRLMQLEDELGAQLFVRGKRKIALTPAGLFLKRRAGEIVELTERTRSEFSAERDAVGGVIAIGSGEGEIMRFLAETMNEFGSRYPAVRFDIYSNNADYVQERLERGTLDLGLLFEPAELSKYEYIRLPHRDRWGMLVRSCDGLAEKRCVTPEDLRGRRVFMSMQRGAAMGVRDWFGGEYQKLDVYAGYNLLYNAAMLVDCCMGAAVCIEGATSLYKNPDLVFIPFYLELSVSAVLVWKKYQPLPAAVERFVEFIRQKVKDAVVG